MRRTRGTWEACDADGYVQYGRLAAAIAARRNGREARAVSSHRSRAQPLRTAPASRAAGSASRRASTARSRKGLFRLRNPRILVHEGAGQQAKSQPAPSAAKMALRQGPAASDGKAARGCRACRAGRAGTGGQAAIGARACRRAPFRPTAFLPRSTDREDRSESRITKTAQCFCRVL